MGDIMHDTDVGQSGGAVKHRIIFTMMILLGSVFFLSFRSTPVPLLDDKTDQYFKGVSSKAVAAYAATRGVNAVVSIMKESELSVSPAGIGVSIAAGQVLDPLDDMTERLSDVLVLAIVSMGMQKIIFEVGQLLSFQVIGCLLPFLLVPLWCSSLVFHRVGTIVVKLLLVIFVLRFLLPGSMLVNDFFYTGFMEDNINQKKDQLRMVTEGSSGISKFDTIQYQDGILESINSSLSSMSRKIERMQELYDRIRNNLVSIISSLLELTVLYTTLFFIQVICIPLFVLWGSVRGVNVVFDVAAGQSK